MGTHCWRLHHDLVKFVEHGVVATQGKFRDPPRLEQVSYLSDAYNQARDMTLMSSRFLTRPPFDCLISTLDVAVHHANHL